MIESGALHSYEYDANGLRTKKIEAGTEARFLLDGPSVLTEYDGSNAATRRYLQNPESIDDILEFTEGGQAYFPLTDALGSVVAITDSVGAVVRRNNYEVFGARTSTGSGPEWAFGFTGREQDSSGLNYNLDRFYISRTGNWLQPDRAGMIDGPSRYQYVRSSPAQFTDPFGLSSDVSAFRFLHNPAEVLSTTPYLNATSVSETLFAKALDLRASGAVPCAALVQLIFLAISLADNRLAAGLAMFRYGNMHGAQPTWSMFYQAGGGPTGFRPEFLDPTGSEQVHHAMAAVGLSMVAMSLLGDSLGFYVATGMGFLHEVRTSAMGATPGGRFEFEDVQINRTAAFVGSNALGANAYSAAQFAASQFCEGSGGCP